MVVTLLALAPTNIYTSNCITIKIKFVMKSFFFCASIAMVSLSLFSCSKSDLSQPAVSASEKSAQVQSSVVAAAVVQTSPTPGNYTVPLYVNDGDTSTASFTGYVFTFSANGKLTAKVGKATYTGKWEVKSNGTQLNLDIDGTPALHGIKKEWNEVKLTTTIINLNHDEHGLKNRDVLNFTMM
jgi:hypothetical protein